jgi:hypothetical protein
VAENTSDVSFPNVIGLVTAPRDVVVENVNWFVNVTVTSAEVAAV